MHSSGRPAAAVRSVGAVQAPLNVTLGCRPFAHERHTPPAELLAQQLSALPPSINADAPRLLVP